MCPGGVGAGSTGCLTFCSLTWPGLVPVIVSQSVLLVETWYCAHCVTCSLYIYCDFISLLSIYLFLSYLLSVSFPPLSVCLSVCLSDSLSTPPPHIHTPSLSLWHTLSINFFRTRQLVPLASPQRLPTFSEIFGRTRLIL